MVSVPPSIGFGAVPGASVLVDAGGSLITALLVVAVVLACGILIRLAIDARTPRIEIRPAAAVPRDVRRVA